MRVTGALRLRALAGPFCHRALLTLEEKNASYEKHYVDFANKPDWYAPQAHALLSSGQLHPSEKLLFRLFKVNPKGSVPAIKDLESDKWITDSGEFVEYLEDKIPEPKLGKADSIPDV